MKVMYVASGDNKYGAPKSMIDMILPLKKLEVEPIVLACNDGELTDFCRKNNIEEHIVGSSEFLVVGGSNILRMIIKHILTPYLIVKYLRSKKNCIQKIKKYVDLTNIDLIHTNVNRVNSGAELSVEYDIPHVWHLREFGKEDYNCMSLMPDYIDYMNRHATAFIAISNAVKKSWAMKGLDSKKIVVINDGITSDGFISKTNYRKRPDDSIKIVFCGLVSETKGQKQLIDAVALLDEKYKKRITVDFYGGGREKYISFLKKYVRSLGLEKQIHFCGYCNKLNKKLSGYDIGVVASRAEALGRVTVEYMYAGLYVIASNSGANPDILANNKYGGLYPVGNSKALAKLLVEAIDNPKMCEEKSSKAKIMAHERFSMESSARKVERLYAFILNNRGKSINAFPEFEV